MSVRFLKLVYILGLLLLLVVFLAFAPKTRAAAFFAAGTSNYGLWSTSGSVGCDTGVWYYCPIITGGYGTIGQQISGAVTQVSSTITSGTDTAPGGGTYWLSSQTRSWPLSSVSMQVRFTVVDNTGNGGVFVRGFSSESEMLQFSGLLTYGPYSVSNPYNLPMYYEIRNSEGVLVQTYGPIAPGTKNLPVLFNLANVMGNETFSITPVIPNSVSAADGNQYNYVYSPSLDTAFDPVILSGTGQSTALTPTGIQASAATPLTPSSSSAASIATTAITGATASAGSALSTNNGVVWATTATGSSGLSTATFQEGVGAIVNAITQPAAVGTNNADIDARLDTANGHLANIETVVTGHLDTAIVNATNQASFDAATASATAQGAADASAASALFGSPLGAGGNSTADSVGGSPSIFAITMPPAMGGASINFDPMSSGRLGPLFDVARPIEATLLFIYLGIWVFGECNNMGMGVHTVKQAQGNTVLGSGGQITSFINAAIIGSAIIVFLTALLAWSFSSIDATFLKALSTTSAGLFASLGAATYYLLSHAVPIPAFMACLTARLSFRWYAMPLYHIAAMVIKFTVA